MPARVLIVEDNPAVRDLLVEYVSLFGHEPVPAANGERGLALAAAQPPDLVITDVCLPGISGLELCRRLKGAPATRHVPVLLVTGIPSDVETASVEAGADKLLGKPFNMETLRRVVGELLVPKRVGE
ncbi:MAG: response regulator [Candidatus Methylomirabilales bacterium]